MRKATAVVLWVLLLCSVALNAVTIWFILRARQVTVDTAYTAKAVVDRLAADTIRYDYAISQTVPLRVVVPIEEDVTVPISTVIPLKTTVAVNVDTGIFGMIPLNIPIDAQFPVNISFPVHVKKDVTIATVIPVSTTVPIRVEIAQTPLADYLRQISEGLDQTMLSLGGAPSPASGQNP